MNVIRLYKYRGGDEKVFHRDLTSLTESCYWAAEISSLNDPCESLVDHISYKPQLEQIVKALMWNNKEALSCLEERHAKLEGIKSQIQGAGVFSLSRTYYDELLWAHYGNSHKGFCVEYDAELLLTHFNQYQYNKVPVKYSDTLPKVKFEDFRNRDILLQKLIGTKSLRWAYEQEVRIVMDNPGANEHDYRAVKSIYFGLRMSEEHKDILMEQLKGRSINYYQMYLENNSYKFKAAPIKDRFQGAPKYLYKVAPVVTETPVSEQDVKQEYQLYIPYLYKAIEVARREPYCAEVLYAGFSSYEGTPENPVIYVHTKRSNGDYKNYTYNINEIDAYYIEIMDLD